MTNYLISMNQLMEMVTNTLSDPTELKTETIRIQDQECSLYFFPSFADDKKIYDQLIKSCFQLNNPQLFEAYILNFLTLGNEAKP